MNIHPVWCPELEDITKYSHIDLLKCMNILLNNYNELKLGTNKVKTEIILGPNPKSYETVNILDFSLDSEMLNKNGSVSPRNN